MYDFFSRIEVHYKCIFNTFVIGILLLNCQVPLEIKFGETIKQWKYFYISLVFLYFFISYLAYIRQSHIKFYFTNSVIIASSIIGGIEALWGGLQIFHLLPAYNSLYRLTGNFFNPGPYACYLSMCLPASIHLVFSKDKYLSFLGIITSWLIFIILLVSMSRTAWFAAILSNLTYFIIARPKATFLNLQNCRHKTPIIMAAFILISFFSVLTYSIKKTSADGRFYIWKIELIAIINKPTGYGQGNFQIAYAKAQEDYIEKKTNTNKLH